MRRRDLLKLAAAAPLGFFGRRSPAASEGIKADVASIGTPLVLRVMPIVARLWITEELLADPFFSASAMLPDLEPGTANPLRGAARRAARSGAAVRRSGSGESCWSGRPIAARSCAG